MKWQQQSTKIVAKATSLSYTILRSFSPTNNPSGINAYKIYIRPLLEFNTVVWNSCNLVEIRCVEKVQRTFTRKLLQRCNVKYNSYLERLKILSIDSLELRRLQFDLITVYKIFHKYIDLSIEKFFTPIQMTYNLRFHKLAIKKQPIANTQVLQKSFKYRIVDAWNSLPNTLVLNHSLPNFKFVLQNISLQRFFM